MPWVLQPKNSSQVLSPNWVNVAYRRLGMYKGMGQLMRPGHNTWIKYGGMGQITIPALFGVPTPIMGHPSTVHNPMSVGIPPGYGTPVNMPMGSAFSPITISTYGLEGLGQSACTGDPTIDAYDPNCGYTSPEAPTTTAYPMLNIPVPPAIPSGTGIGTYLLIAGAVVLLIVVLQGRRR